MEITGMEGDDPPSPLTPLLLTPEVKLDQVDLPKKSIITRPGFGTCGRQLPVLANHFKVSIKNPDEFFFQYSVSINFEDGRMVDYKVIRRKVIDQLYQLYSLELAGKKFAYDGEQNLYTVGPLPHDKLDFTVVLEDSVITKRNGNLSDNGSQRESSKRSKSSIHSKAFKVEITFAAKIPLRSISLALQGAEPEKDQDVLRVLDILLSQQAANRGCLLFRQSFFHDDSRTFIDIGGGVTSVRGFHSSFHPTLGGLSLNMDVSTTVILKPGPVLDFLLSNQNAKEAREIDWVKAKKTLKNMRIKASHSNREFKITGLSEKPCNQQFFSMCVKGVSNNDETLKISVYDYFVKHHNIEPKRSAYMPCIDVGKSKRPSYLPLELCSLVSLQRYTKALSGLQRVSLVDKSRQKPPERIQIVTNAVRNYHYDEDPLLATCGVSIEKQLTQIDARVLEPPMLKVGNSEDCVPRNGRWNFNNKKLLNPIQIYQWALVNFSARCDTSHLSRELINCGRNKGIHIERPYTIIEEDHHYRKSSPAVRVEQMFEQIIAKLPGPPEFLLCVLPERKFCDIYGPWKKKCLTSLGIPNQCISPSKISDQYLTNVLLKINTKLGGTNSLLAIEHTRGIPHIMDKPTMILGMDVSRGFPGRSDIPSIAAVVSSRSWPLISRYRAAVRTQSSKVQLIESLFKPLENGDDDGIMRELLLDFYKTSNGCKPTQIIIFRDGVSESQFAQVLNIELDQIIKAYQYLGESQIPKFTLIIAQKNHHTRLFQASASENVPSGTVVDTQVVHPRNYDFYMCTHAGMIGTSRPTHYHVLVDEIGFSPDELQNLILSLSYVYQRSTAATSTVAPVCYARLAAQQMGQFLKFEDSYETLPGQSIPVPQLPKLHKDVAGSMFFC